jgi:hypothetical protein
MAKSASSGLLADLQQDVAGLATLWTITRKDGVTLRFTDLDTDVLFDGDTYSAAVGYTRTAIESQVGTSVDNVDVTGFFNDDAISEHDLRAGRYDYANVSIRLVNWQNLANGPMTIRTGTLGEVNFSDNGQYSVEIRGLTQAYTTIIGVLVQAECRANVGDLHCKIPLKPPVVKRGIAYAVGQFVRAPVAVSGIANPDIASIVAGLITEDYDNRIYVCATAGTTDATTQPVYDETVGDGTTDGSAVFEAMESWTRSAVVASVVGDDRTFTITVDEPRASSATQDAENSAELSILQSMVSVEQAMIATATSTDVNGNTIYESLNTPSATPAAPWFTYGAVGWDTGLNAGLAMEIKGWDATTNKVTVYLAMPYTVAVGDKLSIYPGCTKLVPACANKFNNVLNYRGEPYVPGQDAILAYPTPPGTSG